MDHPAEACVVDLELMKNNAPDMHRAVTGEPLPDPVLTSDGWSAERVRFFGRGSNTVDAETIEEVLGAVERRGSPIRWASGRSAHGKFRGGDDQAAS